MSRTHILVLFQTHFICIIPHSWRITGVQKVALWDNWDVFLVEGSFYEWIRHILQLCTTRGLYWKLIHFYSLSSYCQPWLQSAGLVSSLRGLCRGIATVIFTCVVLLQNNRICSSLVGLNDWPLQRYLVLNLFVSFIHSTDPREREFHHTAPDHQNNHGLL
jgi:hypothetical protein